MASLGDGSVWSWGDNSEGQIGDGTRVDRSLPQAVPGIKANSVAAGQYHSLALKADGTLVAWGSNASGQLGDGTRATRSRPVAVRGITGATAIAAGWNHSLALTGAGRVLAWGLNDWGQLGNNVSPSDETEARNDSTQAVEVLAENDQGQIAPLTDVVAVAAGRSHSLALRRDGTVWLWGYVTYDEDDDEGTNYFYPVAFKVAVTDATAIAAGEDFSLVLRRDGTVWGWGDNYYGQLGDASDVSAPWSAPVQARGLTGIRAIAAGRNHSLAIGTNGSAWRWGFRYSNPNDGLDYYSSSPQQIQEITTAVAGAGGIGFALVVGEQGRVGAWGDNADGQLGDGALIVRAVPAALSSLSGVTAVAAGLAHSIALRADGNAWTWGANDSGQLGDGRFVDRSRPVRVSGLSGVSAIAAGAYHSVALKSDGTVWTWGRNYFGQLGEGGDVDSAEPTQLLYRSGTTNIPLTGVTSIASGDDFNLALTSDGTVWQWGYNYYDAESDTHYYYPWAVRITGIPAATAIGAGANHGMAVGTDGTLWAWGDNYFGQLGDGSDTSRYNPVRVPGLSGVASVSGGYYHSLAKTTDGNVWQWGYSRYDNGSDTHFYFASPQKIAAFTNVAGIEAGRWHSLAVLNDGTVWSWGFNYAGQLADGSFERFRQQPQVAVNSSVNGVFDLDLTIANQVPCALAVEATKSGSIDALSAGFRLSLAPQTNCVRTEKSARSGFAADSYQVYVAAIHASNGTMVFYQGVGSDGAPLPAPVWTQYTGGALPMFAANMSGGIDDHVQVALFSNLDTRQFAGYDIYVGYGTSADEMVSAGRYKKILALGADGMPSVSR